MFSCHTLAVYVMHAPMQQNIIGLISYYLSYYQGINTPSLRLAKPTQSPLSTLSSKVTYALRLRLPNRVHPMSRFLLISAQPHKGTCKGCRQTNRLSAMRPCPRHPHMQPLRLGVPRRRRRRILGWCCSARGPGTRARARAMRRFW